MPNPIDRSGGGKRPWRFLSAALFLVSLIRPCIAAGAPDTPSGSKAAAPPREWSDVFFVDKPEPTLSYRTGWVVYEESLTKGQFVGRGWNASGFISFYDGRINSEEHPMPEAFWLVIDGQSLVSDWQWGGLEKKSTGDGKLEVVVTLVHGLRPITVKVHTRLDGTAILTRWLEITNTGTRPAAISAADSWAGVMQDTQRWQSLLQGTNKPLYSLGYFDSAAWSHEGDFHWHDLPAAGYRVDGRNRRARHRQPFFVLRNNATGELFIGELAWSGGYSFQFDLDPEADSGAALSFRAGPDARPPLRVVAPGETVSTPEMHLGAVFGGFDDAIQAMQTHLRRSVFLPHSRGHGSWVEYGIGPEIEITAPEVMHALDIASQIGAEVFFIDASWYAAPGSKWWNTVGDWNVNRQRFPEGLKPFRDRAHAAGMAFGLWMDAERLGNQSRTFKEHPDWVATNYEGEHDGYGMIDMTNPQAARWVEGEIARVIEENQLDFFRLDFNTKPGLGIKARREGYLENGYWRYYEAVYAMYQRLRARFPNVIFENCAGGGGRADIGMVRWFDHTWVTDWQVAPRSFMITNGMTMALPPEYVNRLLGGQSSYTTSDFDFQARLLDFGMPTLAFLYPLGSEPNPLMMARAKHWVETYKNFVRPFMDTGRIYHHTPEVAGIDPHGWGVLEMDSSDRTRGICGLFQLSAPAEPQYRLRMRGLDASRRYRVTFENSGQTAVVDGFTLMNEGITVRLEGALTSEMLLFEAE